MLSFAFNVLLHFEQAALPAMRVPHPQTEQGQYKAMNHNRIASASNAKSTSTRQSATMQAAQSRGIQRYKECKSAGIARSHRDAVQAPNAHLKAAQRPTSAIQAYFKLMSIAHPEVLYSIWLVRNYWVFDEDPY